MPQFDFDECRAFAEGCNDSLEDIIRQEFPDAISIDWVSHLKGQLKGADFAVRYKDKVPLIIDAKVREVDFGLDDVALETWSDIDRKKVGWTRDYSKLTDFVLFYWKDTGKYWLVSFPPLRDIFNQHWQEWRDSGRYRVETQDSGEWRSECIFIPRKLIKAKSEKYA